MRAFFLLAVIFISLGRLSLGVGYATEGNILYANQKIKYLAEILSLKNSMPNNDTIMIIPSLYINKAVTFRYNENQRLSHIGVSLFSDETKKMIDDRICNFLERFFLELILQGDREGICFKMNEYHTQLLIDGQDYIKSDLWTLTDILNEMQMPINFNLKCQDGRADAVWIFENHRLQLVFPLYREFIEGTDKKESDFELYNKIQGVASEKVALRYEEVDENSLVKKQDSIYVLYGEQYRIKELSSDRFYIKQGDKFHPVFHIDYPEYSLNNLFLTGAYSKNVTLQLMHRQYGHFTPEISIPLVNFLNFLQDDFTLTCHTGYNKHNELETIVVMNHNYLDYIHMLRVHVKKEDLFKSNLILKGDFYSNIPQHYIKALLR